MSKLIVFALSSLLSLAACATKINDFPQPNFMKANSATETVIGDELKLTVWDLTTMQPREQRVRRLKFIDTAPPYDTVETMHLLAGKQAGVHYAGWALSHYFDTGTEIVGVDIMRNGVVGFTFGFPSPSKVGRKPHDLDSLQGHWAANGNRAVWRDLLRRSAHADKQFDLDEVFQQKETPFWSFGGAVQRGEVGLVVSKVSADGPWMRFDLIYQPNGEFHGAVWLDIRNQRLVRAVKSDRQVFPMETSAPR